MVNEINQFLEGHNIAVLTTLLGDGSPHSATLHFSNQSDSLNLYFSTKKTSRKCGALTEKSSVKGSVVIGFSEEEWLTLQLDGEVILLDDVAEISEAQRIHYAKHPSLEKWKDNSDTVMLKFKPKWWRYSDFNAKPPVFISSES